QAFPTASSLPAIAPSLPRVDLTTAGIQTHFQSPDPPPDGGLGCQLIKTSSAVVERRRSHRLRCRHTLALRQLRSTAPLLGPGRGLAASLRSPRWWWRPRYWRQLSDC